MRIIIKLYLSHTQPTHTHTNTHLRKTNTHLIHSILPTLGHSQIELNPKLFDLNPLASKRKPTPDPLPCPAPKPKLTPFGPPAHHSMSCSIYRSQRSRNEANPATKHTMTPGIPLMSAPQMPMRQQHHQQQQQRATWRRPHQFSRLSRLCFANYDANPRSFIWRMHCSSASLRIQLVTWADRDCSRAAIATASSRYYRWISVPVDGPPPLPQHAHLPQPMQSSHKECVPQLRDDPS